MAGETSKGTQGEEICLCVFMLKKRKGVSAKRDSKPSARRKCELTLISLLLS